MSRPYIQSSFILLNNFSGTTIPTMYRQPSTIDLTFVTSELHALVRKWKVGIDPMGSDHLPILIQMETPKSNYSTRYNPRVIKRN